MSVCEVLGTKPNRKGTLGTFGRTLGVYIKERLTGKQCGNMKLFRLAQRKIQYRFHLDTAFKLVGQKVD
jgi:hypothetical protein